MSYSRLETIFRAFEELAERCNRDGMSDNVCDIAHELGLVSSRAFFLGFNCNAPWKSYLDNLDIFNRPDFPAFLSTLKSLNRVYKQIESTSEPTDRQVVFVFRKAREHCRIAGQISKQYQLEYPPIERWTLQSKVKVSTRIEPLIELVVPPGMPLKSREGIEDALKEMYYFVKDTYSCLVGALCDIRHLLMSVSLSCSFLGFHPHPGWKELVGEWELSDQPEYSEFLTMMNQIYRLFREIRICNDATEEQIIRIYVLGRKLRKIQRTVSRRHRREFPIKPLEIQN